MKHLYEAAGKMNPTKINSATRQKANKDMDKAGLGGKKRYPKVASAINDAWNVLGPMGLEPDSSVPYLSGNTGSFSQGLRWTNKEDLYSPSDIANSVLYVQWTKLETGYEVIAYLS